MTGIPPGKPIRQAVWLFQANPLRQAEAFTQVDFARSFARSTILSWGCRQHWKDVLEGDLAVIFFTGRLRGGGIYGVGEIVQGPEWQGDEVLIALLPKTTAYLLANPLTYEDLSGLGLKNMRMRRLTVYPVTEQQWSGILQLLAGRAPGVVVELGTSEGWTGDTS